MFGGDSNSGANSLANYFSKYREENNHLITKFKNILTYLKRLDKYEDYEKSEVVGSGLFGDTQLGQVFDSLDVNLKRAMETIENLLKSLKKEKEDITKHLGKLKHGVIESIKKEETLLINYNKEQYDYMQELNTMIPNVIELFENVVGTEDSTYQSKAAGFKVIYEKLIHALVGKADKAHLYKEVIRVLRDLRNYMGGHETVFESHLGKDSAEYRFVRNYYGLASENIKKIEKKIKDAGIDEDTDTFEINTDENGFDKLMKGTLEKLFTGVEKIRVGDKEYKPKDLIGEIIKVDTDLKELKDGFDTLKKDLQTAISKITHFRVGRGGFKSIE